MKENDNPEQLAERSPLPGAIQGVWYDDGGDLFRALEQLGLPNLRIVLNDQGFAVWQEMPGPIHNAGVQKIQKSFQDWEKEQEGAVLYGEKRADVYYMQNFKKDIKHCSDYAIWGPDCLESDEVAAVDGKALNPHVVFQFSWGDDIHLMRRRRQSTTCPCTLAYMITRPLNALLNVIYLIRTLRKSMNSCLIAHGFDMYVTRQGDRIADQPTFSYHVGGGVDDVTIEVSADDMGLPEGANNFSISLAKICSSLEKYNVVFEPENEDEDY